MYIRLFRDCYTTTTLRIGCRTAEIRHMYLIGTACRRGPLFLKMHWGTMSSIGNISVVLGR